MEFEKKRLKVLLWSPAGAGLHYGGASTSAYRLYSAAEDGLFDVTLVHGSPEQTKESLFKEIINLGPLDPFSAVSLLRFLFKSRNWLRKNASRFDVFHGIAPFEPTLRPASYAQSIGLPSFVKPISHLNGFTSARGWKRVLRLPEGRRRTAAKLSGIIAISSAIENELLGYGIPRDKIWSIPNGVNTERFCPSSAEEREKIRSTLGWEKKDFVILYVGTLDPRKQPAPLLESIVPLLKEESRLKLAFVGPARISAHLEMISRIVEREDLGKQVQFFGMRKDVEIFYRAADLYCLPSLNEGMPNGVLEALSSGIPAIVTPVSGSEDLVENGVNGYIFNDVEAIPRIVKSYLEDPQLQRIHGENARRLMEENYDSKIVARRHYEIFSRALNRPISNP